MRSTDYRRIARPFVGMALVVVLAVSACDAVESGDNDDGSTEEAEPESLEGETIEFVVPYEPGGGYDIYARLAAPYLEECSDATVVVENEPGAGSLLATAQTFISPPDELRMQITNTVGIAGAQIGDAEGVQFDVDEFSWLGRVSTEPNVMVVANDSDISEFEDIMEAEEEVSFAATGPGANEYINATILPEVYDFPSRIVTGFGGGDDARASVMAGDVDAHIQPLDSQLPLIQSGELQPILVIGEQEEDLLPDTPTVADFDPESDEQRAILDSLLALTENGRGVAASPDLEPGKAAALEEALACALGDEEFVAEAEQQQRSIMPLSGSETAELVEEVIDAPEDFQRLVEEAS